MNDGYPTEETLHKIRTWDATEAVELMQFVKENWWCPLLSVYGWMVRQRANCLCIRAELRILDSLLAV